MPASHSRQEFATYVNFNDFSPKQEKDIEELFQLADDMASAACCMNTNLGYSNFVASREKFQNFVKASAAYYVRVDLD